MSSQVPEIVLSEHSFVHFGEAQGMHGPGINYFLP